MRTLEIINLTPHDVVLLYATSNKIKYIFSKHNKAPRCEFHTETEETVLLKGTDITVPLSYTKYGKTIELPEPRSFTVYIVSDIIAKMLSHIRDDLRICNGIVRDQRSGKVIGCKSLGRI